MWGNHPFKPIPKPLIDGPTLTSDPQRRIRQSSQRQPLPLPQRQNRIRNMEGTCGFLFLPVLIIIIIIGGRLNFNPSSSSLFAELPEPVCFLLKLSIAVLEMVELIWAPGGTRRSQETWRQKEEKDGGVHQRGNNRHGAWWWWHLGGEKVGNYKNE
ncbi:uncharacterized protein G2W53_018453 [Senna tora]|uniref:Uncharacterized protein n=1 Tax=Senna tora TaxID=362788 RepID=A0A834TT47_9FABA|nr:uncharacterized protein G2W53_018453 [Senna tora]